jgi:hypothetical protein
MFYGFCWNVVFALELVGASISGFMFSVGTKKRPNGLLEGTNKITSIIIQHVTCKKCQKLERWIVGTENDLPVNEIIFL